MRLGSLVLLLLLLALLSLPTVEASDEVVSHAPIWIQGDSGFTTENGVVAGSGSPEDPYIIEGWQIDASSSRNPVVPGDFAGIFVQNTRAPFVIRNVRVHGLTCPPECRFFNTLIALKNVTAGRVEASQIQDGSQGVLLWFSENNIITRNEISALRSVGIYVSQSSRNIVQENTVYDVGWPIIAFESSHNRFLRNTIEGREPLTASAGVSIERNSSFNVFQENTIRGGRFGVSVFLSSHSNLIIGNTITGVERSAIEVIGGSKGNIVQANTIVDSGRGVFLRQTLETRVESNWISAKIRTSPPGLDRITGKGVWLIDSSYSWITANTITAPAGISICNSKLTFIAPPPNDLSGSDRPVVQGPSACP